MRHWTARALALLLLVALAAPGFAGKKKKEKKKGGINPSSMTVIDDDFDMNMVDPAPDFGAWRPTGAGIVVAVLDGGFNLHHPSLLRNLLPVGFDAIDWDGDPHDTGNGWDDDGEGCPDSAVGHGTFVAGMVLAAAPDAMILPVRVRDDEGFGTNDELIMGIEFAVAAGADVINLSLDGAAARKRDIGHVLRMARDAGVVVILSAGNDGEELNKDPMTNETIVVGAAHGWGEVAEFSNFSERDDVGQLMLYADGVDLLGPTGHGGDDQSWAIGSGTSFSTGLVSGAVAAFLEKHPQSDVPAITSALRRSIDPVWHRERGVLPGGKLNVERLVTE